MKRQHPDNPELFWCPKCQGYKERGEFHQDKNDKNGVASRCRNCLCRKRRLPYKYSEESKKRMVATQFKKGERASPCTEFCEGFIPWNKGKKVFIQPWNDSQTIVVCPQCLQSFKIKPSRVLRTKNNYCSRECSFLAKFNGGHQEQLRKKREGAEVLNDMYIKILLQNNKMPIIPETIELKRQQIIMKRTLKEFKKWRDGNATRRI